MEPTQQPVPQPQIDPATQRQLAAIGITQPQEAIAVIALMSHRVRHIDNQGNTTYAYPR
jgi:hypothetical protein